MIICDTLFGIDNARQAIIELIHSHNHLYLAILVVSNSLFLTFGWDSLLSSDFSRRFLLNRDTNDFYKLLPLITPCWHDISLSLILDSFTLGVLASLAVNDPFDGEISTRTTLFSYDGRLLLCPSFFKALLMFLISSSILHLKDSRYIDFMFYSEKDDSSTGMLLY